MQVLLHRVTMATTWKTTPTALGSGRNAGVNGFALRSKTKIKNVGNCPLDNTDGSGGCFVFIYMRYKVLMEIVS